MTMSMTMSGQLARGGRRAALSFGLVFFATGCPDPQGRFDRFLEETEDEREEAMNMKLDVGGTLADVSGTHFFALAPGFSPETPLQFIATATFTAQGEGGLLDLDLQPLQTKPGDATREPVGEVIEIRDAAVDANGSFSVDLGDVTLTGEANPLTGSDIVGMLVLTGAIQTADVFCGTVSGAITQPLAQDLMGSTFAATRIEDTNAAALPDDFLTSCPAGGSDEPGSENE